jgi:hypothetical protein
MAAVIPLPPRDPGERLLAELGALVDRMEAASLSETVITGKDLQRISGAVATGANRQAAALAKAHNRRTIVIAVLGAVALIGLGFGGGYRYAVTSRSSPVVVNCPPHQPGQPFACTMQVLGD